MLNGTLIRIALAAQPIAPESPSVTSYQQGGTEGSYSIGHLQVVPLHADAVLLQKQNSEGAWEDLGTVDTTNGFGLTAAPGSLVRFLACNPNGVTPGPELTLPGTSA